MSFKISKTSQSFKFLMRYNKSFKAAMKQYDEDGYLYGYIPRTFCDYYRMVFNYVAYVFGGGICIAMIPFFWLVFCNGNFENPTSWHVFFLLPFFLAGFAGNLALGAFAVFGIAYTLVHYVIPPICSVYESIADKLRSDSTPKEKQPSALSTWVKAKKEKYCPLVEYDR